MRNIAAGPEAWDGRPYNALNQYLRHKFGRKVFKIPIDAGFTCPNRDGNKSVGGCAFCGSKGAGDFAAGSEVSLLHQFESGKGMMHRKWKEGFYIVYFQAFTNTYAPVEKLHEVFYSLLNEDGVVGIAISTRPDCLSDEILNLLAQISQIKFLWVELGLQTVNPGTIKAMNMQYSSADFQIAVHKLSQCGIPACGHVILGLPGDQHQDMLDTVRFAVDCGTWGLKLHLFHLMKDSALSKGYYPGKFHFMDLKEYAELVVDILEETPANQVIHRLTGDSPRDLLIEPRWSLNKWEVLNAIDNEFRRRSSWQGCRI